MVRMMLVLVCVAMFAGSCAAAEEPRSHLTRRRLATAAETGAEYTLLHTGLAKIQKDIGLVKSLPANYLKVATALRHSKQCLIDAKIAIMSAQLAAQVISLIPSAKTFATAAKQVLKLANDAVEIQNKMLAEPANVRPAECDENMLDGNKRTCSGAIVANVCVGKWDPACEYESTTTAGIIYVYEGGKGAKVKAACASVDTKLGYLELAVKVPSMAAMATGLAFTAIADVAAKAGKDATCPWPQADNTANSMYPLADKMEKIASNANAAYTKQFATMAPFIKGVADAAAVVTKYELAACSMIAQTKIIIALMAPIVKAMNTKISLPCVCTPAVPGVAKKLLVKKGSISVIYKGSVTSEKCRTSNGYCAYMSSDNCKKQGSVACINAKPSSTTYVPPANTYTPAIPGIPSKCAVGQPAKCQKFGDTLVEASVKDVLDGVDALLKPLMDQANKLIKPFTDAVANVLPKLPLPPIPKLPTIDTFGLTAFAISPMVDISAIKDWAAMAKAPVSSEAAIGAALKDCTIPSLIQPSWDPTTTEDGKTLKSKNGGVPPKNGGGGPGSAEEFTQLTATVAALGKKADKEVATSATAVATADKEAKDAGDAANKAAADAKDAADKAAADAPKVPASSSSVSSQNANAASGLTVAAAAVSAVAAVVGLLM